MDEDLTLDSAPKTQPKKGRRAKVLLNKSKEVLNEKKDDSNSSGVSSRPSRRQMGWDKNSNTSVNEPIDARLIPDNNSPIDDDEAHIIPDLAEIHEDTMAQEVAAPPSLFTSNIASYKELDLELMNRSAFRTLDGDIDLKVLVKNLSSEQEVAQEPDAPWQWESLFAEVSGTLLSPQETVATPSA